MSTHTHPQVLLVVGQRTDQIRDGDHEELIAVHKDHIEGCNPVFRIYKGDMNNRVSVKFKETQIQIIARSSTSSFTLYVNLGKERDGSWSYFLGTPVSFSSADWVSQGSILSRGRIVLCAETLDEILQSLKQQQEAD